MSTKKPTPALKGFNPLTNTYSYLYTPPTGFCGPDCVECSTQFRSMEEQHFDAQSYSKSFSIAEATTIASSYAKDIQSDLHYLRDVLSCHGNTIVSRWTKSREKRSLALTDAFPKIYPQQWAPAHLSYDFPQPVWKTARNFREASLLPWLSLEALRDDPYKFLSLLYHRTKYDPEQWVAFDKHQTRANWTLGVFQTEFADCGIVFYGSRYGEVCKWNMEEGHRWDIIGFPRGRQVLEAQHLVMRLLRNTVEGLLQGVVTSDTSEKWYRLVASGFRKSIRFEKWSVFSNQAFSTPIFDPDRLLDIAKDRFAQAEDHLWLLQTDAAYFHMYLKKETQGKFFKNTDPELLSRKLAMDVFLQPMEQLQHWQRTVDEAEHVKTMYHRFRDSINLGQTLPPKFEFALASFELLLVNQLLGRITDIKDLLPRLAGFEHNYRIDTSKRNRVETFLNEQAAGKTAGETFYIDPLFWCILQATADPENPTMFDTGMLFRFLDDWLAKDSTTYKDKCRLDERLLELLSDLAAINELLWAVRLHRPLGKPTSIIEVKSKQPVRRTWRTISFIGDKDLYNYNTKDHTLMAAFFKKVQKTPFPKGKRDKNWLDDAHASRKALRNFWDEARKMRQKSKSMSNLYTEEDNQIDLASMSFDSTEEHLTMLETERESILSSSKYTATVNTSYSDLSSSGFTGVGWSTDLPDKVSSLALSAQPARQKIKTRPENIKYSPTENQIALEPESITSTPQSIHINRESIRVLSRMYPSTVDEFNGKPIEWKSFVAFLADAGFPASQSGGSAVTFVKDGEGRIVFHKPHPVAKIDQIMLVSWGKRMKKWFSWGRDVFVESKNGD